jgi:hypothetical protein
MQMEAYALSKGYPDLCSFAEVLEHFKNEAQQEVLYKLCNQTAILTIAQSIDHISPLSVQDRLVFCSAPVTIRKPAILAAFVQMVERFAYQLSLPAPSLSSVRCPMSYKFTLKQHAD